MVGKAFLVMRPEELADNVILVGDPGRVDMIAEFCPKSKSFFAFFKIILSLYIFKYQDNNINSEIQLFIALCTLIILNIF